MSEYVFRYAEGFGFEPTEQPTEHERMADLDHYGTIHEEIVRCRDCKRYDDEPDPYNSGPKCWRDPHHLGRPIWTRPNGFCAWGVRRGDA